MKFFVVIIIIVAAIIFLTAINPTKLYFREEGDKVATQPSDTDSHKFSFEPDPVDGVLVERGRNAYQAYGCWRCHSLGEDEEPGFGDEFNQGPDLEYVGSRLTKDQILESIISPNSSIPEPKDRYSVAGVSKMPSFNDPQALKDINDIAYFLSHSKIKHEEPSADSFIQLNDQSYVEVFQNSDEIFLLYFWAEWCFACHEIEPVLRNLAHQFNGKLKMCKISIDDNPILVQNYVPDLMFPCLVLVKRGNVISRIYGAQGQDDIELYFKNWIESYL